MTLFALVDVPYGEKTSIALRLGVKSCPRCSLYMVNSATKTCTICLKNKKSNASTESQQLTEQTAAAGSVTAGAIATLVAEREA